MPLENDAILAVASAPGKVILLGEHSVVYGRPAIALPVRSLRARAVVRPSRQGLWVHSHLELDREAAWTRKPDAKASGTITAESHAAGRIEPESQAAWSIQVGTEPASEPVAVAVQATLKWLGLAPPPCWRIELRSTIPLARGLGSSAAVAVAVVRAVAGAAGRDLSAQETSALAYQAERAAHGRPSGIDNTVIAWDCPITFVDGQARCLALGAPVPVVIADSGARAPTRELVQAVRHRWLEDRLATERVFDDIQALVERGETALVQGDMPCLGRLLTENQARLRELGVSDRRLEDVIAAACEAGALGAKLSGAGGGGAVIALAPPAVATEVAAAMIAAGAKRTVQAVVE